MPRPGLVVEPNPAVEGQDINVSYSGGDDLYYSVDGGTWQKLPLDDQGQGSVTAPVGSESVVISNRKFPTPANIDVEIISTA